MGAEGAGAGRYGYLVKERDLILPVEPLSCRARKMERDVLDSAPDLDLFAEPDGLALLDEWRGRWLKDPPSWWGTRHHLPAFLGIVELLEDNAGGLWFRPVGQGIVIDMEDAADFVTDSRLYGSEWEPRDLRGNVWPASMLQSSRIVARWSEVGSRPSLELAPPEKMGAAARDYLAVECPACEVVAVPGTCCSGAGS